MQQISATELNQLLQTSDTPPMLLDVREPHEFSHCQIPNSLSMPMRSVPQQMNELPKDRPIVTICHHGMRSLQVAQFLTAQGFDQIINLTGGVDAWATEVDPDMPRY